MSENKKTYVRPDFAMMRFALNDNVALCTPTDETTYPAQTIECVVSGTEYVFYDGCQHDAGTTGSLKDYNGTTYFVWWDGKAGGRPNSAQQEILDGLGITEPGWHAGPVTTEILSIVNSST